MRWSKADVRGESSVFQFSLQALIMRQLRCGIDRRKFGKMNESRRSSSTQLGEVDIGIRYGWLPPNIYLSLRIYLTTSGLLLSSLTKPLFDEFAASSSSMVANRCLLQICKKEWETRESSLRRSVSSFSPTISIIRVMISKGRTSDIVEYWKSNFVGNKTW